MLAGGTDPEKVGWKFTPEEWDRKARGLIRLISHVCDCLRGDAGLYNAMKHGRPTIATSEEGRHRRIAHATAGGDVRWTSGIMITTPCIVKLAAGASLQIANATLRTSKLFLAEQSGSARYPRNRRP
jgi:hypothetical protein